LDVSPFLNRGGTPGIIGTIAGKETHIPEAYEKPGFSLTPKSIAPSEKQGCCGAKKHPQFLKGGCVEKNTLWGGPKRGGTNKTREVRLPHKRGGGKHPHNN